MREPTHVPDRAHQAVHKELVLLCRGFFPCVPYFAVAAFHEPALKIDGMPYERIRDELVRGERERFQRRVEVGDAVLYKQTDEVEPADGEFTLGRREDGAMQSQL